MFHLLRDPRDCRIQTETVEEGGAQIRLDPARSVLANGMSALSSDSVNCMATIC